MLGNNTKEVSDKEKNISLATQLVESNEALLWLYNSVIKLNNYKGKLEKRALDKAMENAKNIINKEYF